MHVKLLQSCLTLCDPMDCSPPGSSVHGDSPGKSTGVGCHALLQGIFSTQWSNTHLLSGGSFTTSTTWEAPIGFYQFSHSVVSDSLWTYGLHHTRLPCLSITNSWSLFKLTSIGSMMPYNHLILGHPLLFLPSICCSYQGLFYWVGSSHQVAKLLEFQLQHQSFQWICRVDFLLVLTGLISLPSKGLTRVFPNTTIQKHQFLSTQFSLWSNSHIHTWLLEKP